MPQSRAVSRPGRQRDLSPDGPLEAIQRLTDAWMRKDLEGMSQQLSNDITELGPAFSRPLVGKRNFFESYKAYFCGPLKIETYRILHPRFVKLTPRLVLAHFRYRMTTRNQDLIEKSSGQESMLVERQRGHWRVKFIHWHKE